MKFNLVVLVCVLILSMCIGGCASQSPVSVSISPQATAMGTGQMVQFNAMVNDSKGVSWSASSGTIDANGNYSSPSGAQSMTVTVKAASQRDPTKSASATVNVVAPGQLSPTANPQVALYKVSPAASANVLPQASIRTDAPCPAVIFIGAAPCRRRSASPPAAE